MSIRIRPGSGKGSGRSCRISRGEAPSGTMARMNGFNGRVTGRSMACEIVRQHPFAQPTDREHANVVMHARIGGKRAHFVLEHGAQLVFPDRAAGGGLYQRLEQTVP